MQPGWDRRQWDLKKPHPSNCPLEGSTVSSRSLGLSFLPLPTTPQWARPRRGGCRGQVEER